MSQKAAKPSLSGQRLKTRKRDEKEKLDPIAFRDEIFKGFEEAGFELDQVNKFLEKAGSKLDYRRYAEQLFDILFAGGLLAPGGSVIEDSENYRTSVCVFMTNDDDESLQKFYSVFFLLIRRYKYLEKAFETEMHKILLCIKGYTDEERVKLAKMTAIFFAQGMINPKCLRQLLDDNLVKEGLALNFACDLFRYWLTLKDMKEIKQSLKQAQMEGKLMELLPLNKRTTENFAKQFNEANLPQIVEYQRVYELLMLKRELLDHVSIMIKNEEPVKEICVFVKQQMKKCNLVEHELVTLMWNTIMNSIEWSKKEQLIAEQCFIHLRTYTKLLTDLTETGRSQLNLMMKVQEYCYDNHYFNSLFYKIIMLLYKNGVLSEGCILKWAKDGLGKSVFREQMKPMVEWLQNAEEETDSEEEEDNE